MSTTVVGMREAMVYLCAEKNKKDESKNEVETKRNGFFIEEEVAAVLSESSSIGVASSESSSIGENSSSEAGEKEEGEEEEEEEVQSKVKEEEEKKEDDGMGLAGSLDSLEDSLPIKRGLSNFYAGKSKSFTSLAEAACTAGAKELAKPENPFNKRRRILAVWSRRASCSSLIATYLPPLLAPDHTVAEEEEELEQESEEEHQQDHNTNNCNNHHNKYNKNKKDAPTFPPPRLRTQRGMMMRNTPFRSPRSFSLSDLQNTSYN